MNTEQQAAVAILLAFLLIWNAALTIGFFRTLNLIDRLDDVLSQALTALGFPKKPKDPSHD